MVLSTTGQATSGVISYMRSISPGCIQGMVTRKEKPLKLWDVGNKWNNIHSCYHSSSYPNQNLRINARLSPPSVSLGSQHRLWFLSVPRGVLVSPAYSHTLQQPSSSRIAHFSLLMAFRMSFLKCTSVGVTPCLKSLLNAHLFSIYLTQAHCYSLSLLPTIPFAINLSSGGAINLAGLSKCHSLSHLHTSAQMVSCAWWARIETQLWDYARTET